METDPIETAGHEAYHFWKHMRARSMYTDTIVDNIDFSSDEFVQFQSDIANIYFGEEVDIRDDGVDKLAEEIFAYITGLVHAGDPSGEVHRFIRDYDAVKAAWDTLVEKQTKGQPTTKAKVNPEDSTGDNPSVGADESVGAAPAGYGSNTVGSAQSRFEHKIATSKVISNSYENATDETIRSVGQDAKEANPNIGQYDVVTEKESTYNADLRTDSAENIAFEYDYLVEKEGWTGKDNDTAFRVLKYLRESGDIDRIQTLVDKQTKEGTRSGQLSQSFAKYSRDTTTARMIDAVETLNGLTENKVASKFYKKKGFNTWKKDVAVVHALAELCRLGFGTEKLEYFYNA